jgi:membrane-bound metal-dependent hydrolase YbcI (DUF457 family)
LGGIAAGWRLVPRKNRRAALLLAAIAAAPDLDLLVGTHRGASHSVGATVIAGLVAAILWRTTVPAARPRDTLRAALCVTLAWGSHILLDWLSNDTRPPIGIMALWPFSHDYYKASIEIFPPVSRRYWESRFWLYNLKALLVELLLLGPIAALVTGYLRRGRRGGPAR